MAPRADPRHDRATCSGGGSDLGRPPSITQEHGAYKAKELIGKAIIQQATGEQIATVQDILLDHGAAGVLALLAGDS